MWRELNLSTFIQAQMNTLFCTSLLCSRSHRLYNPKKRWKEKYQSVDEVFKRSIKHEMPEKSMQVYMKCFMPKVSSSKDRQR